MAETQAQTVQPDAAEAPFPPFNAETFAPQLVWLAITFIALFLIMSRLALPKVARVMAEREDRIADDLDEAERMRKEAGKVEESFQATLAEARAKGQATSAKAKDEIRAKTESLSRDLDAKLDEKMAEAEARIEAMKRDALAEVDTVARDVAAAVVERLIGEAPAEAELAKAVDAARAQKKEAR